MIRWDRPSSSPMEVYMERLTLIASLLAIASCGGNNGAGDGGMLDFGPGTCTLAGTDPMCGKGCTGDHKSCDPGGEDGGSSVHVDSPSSCTPAECV